MRLRDCHRPERLDASCAGRRFPSVSSPTQPLSLVAAVPPNATTGPTS